MPPQACRRLSGNLMERSLSRSNANCTVDRSVFIRLLLRKDGNLCVLLLRIHRHFSAYSFSRKDDISWKVSPFRMSCGESAHKTAKSAGRELRRHPASETAKASASNGHGIDPRCLDSLYPFQENQDPCTASHNHLLNGQFHQARSGHIPCDRPLKRAANAWSIARFVSPIPFGGFHSRSIPPDTLSLSCHSRRFRII